MNGVGYHIIKEAVNIDVSFPMLPSCEADWLPNNSGWKPVFRQKNSSKRDRFMVSEYNCEIIQFKPLLRATTGFLKDYFQIFLGKNTKIPFDIETTILWSKPMCKKQPWHFDYEYKNHQSNLFSVSSLPHAIPLIGIVATEDNTYIDVVPYSYMYFNHSSFAQDISFDGTKKPITLVLKKGDMVIMRGDLLHSGSAYEMHNRRLHFYLDFQRSPFGKHDSEKTNRIKHEGWIKYLSCI